MVQSLIREEWVFVSPAFVAFPFVEVDAQTVFFQEVGRDAIHGGLTLLLGVVAPAGALGREARRDIPATSSWYLASRRKASTLAQSFHSKFRFSHAVINLKLIERIFLSSNE